MRPVSVPARARLGFRSPSVAVTAPRIDALERRLLMAVQPVISEFMADNKSTVADPDGVYSDWVEIYNPNNSPFNLGGYYLTDSASRLTKWQVPADTMISAKGYLVIWANSATTPDTARPLSANFALSKDGEYLALVQPDGVTVNTEFAPTFPPQQEDVSYGLAGTNLNPPSYGFLSKPTPGAANPSGMKVSDVQFSVARGFYNDSFQLALSTPTAGATIRYTLDGNTPTSSSPQYGSPITIDRTTVVRAVAFKSGSAASVVQAQSYVFLDDVIYQPKNLRNQFPTTPKALGKGDLPVPQDTEMDPGVVNGHEAEVKAGLMSIPTLSISTDFDKLFGSKGVYDEPEGKTRTEQPVSVELIDPAHPDSNDGVYGILEGQSHDRMKRSLRLSFKPDFGGPSKWETDLLKNGPLNGGGAAPTKLDDINLRAGNNRNWARNNVPATYAEDEWYRATQVAVSGEGSHGTFVHLYINGAYWGLYNVAERPDEKRYAEQFGLDDADVFAIDHDGDIKGNPARWNALMNDVIGKDMSVLSNYSQLQQYVDLQQFAEYLLVSWYQGQTDWPDNNWWAAGPEDGKFRFYAWDGEKSWDRNDPQSNGAYIEPQFFDPTSNEPIVRVFRSAINSSEFKQLLADTAYRLTQNGGPLADAASQARWDTLNNFISGAIWGEAARWGDIAKSVSGTTYTKDKDWTPEVAKIRKQMSGNGTRLLNLLKAQGWYSTSVKPPAFTQRGGNVSAGFKMTLVPPAGSGLKVYYTLDGTDPRLPGGGVSPSAKRYSAAVALSATANVVVRTLSGTSSWSVKDQATFTIDPFANVRIVEVMYNPAAPPVVTADEQDTEFLEIQNTGKSPVNLKGVSVDGVGDFMFGDVNVPAGGFTVIARNAAAYAARYPGAPAPSGIYPGNLDNGGETIKLINPAGGIIQQFRYEDGSTPDEVAAGFIPKTDGGGYSLTIIDPTADVSKWNLGKSWRASNLPGGTPGKSNVPPVNTAPAVKASASAAPITVNDALALTGTVTDDGLPFGSSVSLTWSKKSGPGNATFADSRAAATTATFSAAGTYVVRLTASDGALSSSADVTVTVNAAPPAPDNKIVGFTLIDAATGVAIRTLLDGDTLDPATLPARVNVIAIEAGPSVGSVKFGFDSTPGKVSSNYRTDNSSQFTLFAQSGGAGGTFAAGAHTLRATPFSATNATGTAGQALQVRFSVLGASTTPVPTPTPTPPPPTVAPAVQQLVLVDAQTDQDAFALTDGMTVRLADFPGLSQFSVRADANSTTGSVLFGYQGNADFSIEKGKPFALFGNTGPDYAGTSLLPGSYELVVTPFANTTATGTSGDVYRVTFTVV